MRGDHLVKDLLPPDGSCRLSFDEQLARTSRKLVARHIGMLLISRDDRKR
jgi:hypothetical protein